MTATRHHSDTEIFSAARKALDDHPRVPQVRVHVNDGTVTLTGSVRWPQEQSEAEAVVRRVGGVRGIVNKIAVEHAVDPEGFEAPESQ
jgi:osmotically-inducible protein OsmY